MKNKPLRHKETNTFQFKPFAERVNEIDVDVFHKVAHRNEQENEDEIETYFYQTIQKWNVLNLTEGYHNFKKEVHGIVTLPQLLNKKEHVIETLEKYLQMKNGLFLQPILELVVAVSRDLQKEFYEYFPNFLKIIIELLRTKDTEQIEYTFTTLAYLFKFLWRYLIRNIDAIYELLLPLLSESQPVYINKFAAESFAFVGRKVKDKHTFFKSVINVLEKKEINGIQGTGKLFFEITAGISGHFHSCCEHVLDLYFHLQDDPSIDKTILRSILEEVVQNILDNIEPQKSETFWRVLLKLIDDFSNHKYDDKSELIITLQLLEKVINFKSGRFVINPNSLINKITVCLNNCESDAVLKELLNVSVAIFLAKSIKIPLEISSQFMLKILSTSNTEFFYNIVERLVNHSSFETIILPHVLKRNQTKSFDSQTLKLYTTIIKEKSPPSLNGIQLEKWKKFNLDVQSISLNFFETSLKNVLNDIDSLRMLVILPHFKSLPTECKTILCQEIQNIYEIIVNKNEDPAIDKYLLTFLLAIDTFIHISEPDDFVEFIIDSNIDILKLLSCYPDKPPIINLLDLILTNVSNSRNSETFINKKIFDDLNNILSVKLNSSIHKVRLVTAHIYSLFNNVAEMFASVDETPATKLPFLAESTPANIQTYREKLLHLQALEFQSQVMFSLNEKYHDFVLRYLLGNFYINFSLIWEPVNKIIATYASKGCQQFWEIFLSELNSENKATQSLNISLGCEIIDLLLIEKYEDKVDNENYQLLLWKSMLNFVEFAETKNRDLTQLFLNNVEENFVKSNSDDAQFCDIEKRDGTEKAVGGEIDENKVFYKKLLLAQMELFGKFSNPRKVFKEETVYKIYLNFLSSKNIEIQKSALNCIFTYKHKFLVPYKENLYNLVNEKNLKNELTKFKIGEENGIILNEHREGLIPILMRILYSKMIKKTGMRTGGKYGGILKRKLILRFLASVREDEMIVFFQMAFKPFQQYVSLEPNTKEELNLDNLLEDVIKNINLKNVIPPKKLLSISNLLNIIFEEFGNKMIKLLPKLFAILLCIFAQINAITNRFDQVHVGFVQAIKNLKTNCLNILGRFFAHFENYNFSTSEINAVFDLAVFPYLEKLPIEGIYSPTVLLKLFLSWSQSSRYFILFVKHDKKNPNLSVLPFIMNLLLNPNTHFSVINMILEILEKLLTLQNFENESMEIDNLGNALKVENTLEIHSKSLPKNVNLGSAILLPHVSNILEYIRRKLKKTHRSGINKTELLILSRISEFVSDADLSDTLLTLTLPILVQKSTKGESEETLIELITTVINLIKNVEKPQIHLKLINPLLYSVSSVPARKLLLELYEVVSKRSTNDQEMYLTNYEIIKNLNAFDSKWIDQPDFQKRLDAFVKISEMIENNSILIDFGVAVVYNCYYFLKHEADLAMKDNSGQYLKKLCVHLLRKYQNDSTSRRYLIDDTILVLVKNGIKNKNESIRLQSLSLIGELAIECSDVHPILKDLSVLCNKTDREVDFFENLQHLQLHRKVRALLKFCNVAKTLKKIPNPKTLTQFVLPIASFYLCNENFIGKNSIVDAAIETVATVCKLLPWYHYEIILKHYLSKLRGSLQFQKQLVRIVVGILDSFHFNLSKFNKISEVKKDESSNEIPLKENLEIMEEDVKKEEGEKEETEVEKKDTDEEQKINIEETEEDIEEKLVEDLNKDIEETEEVLESEDIEDSSDSPVIEKELILSQYAAKRLVFSIVNGLLPQLNRAIISRTRHENSHKVNRKVTGIEKEEEELMRVPIALAVVKLLQKLPTGMLDQNLPGIFMKLCTFLKSRLESVRRATREILQKIMITLGPNYLHHLLREMNSLLTKGFQVHVLVFTIHAVLITLKPFFQPGDINRNLQSILSVCKVDLFGLTAEEKEVIGITKSVSEAKSTKSFDIFHILAQYITETCLLDLILPLKEVLAKTRSHKTVNKINECLRQTVLGLADNTFIDVDKTLIFLYGIISESIPDLNTTKSKQLKNSKEAESKPMKPDCFLIQPEPKNRMGEKAAARTSKNTNAHVLIEFGLKLFHILLKRDRITSPEFHHYLEPFVGVLSDCLKSQHVKISTLALQCLSWIIKMDLAAVKDLISDICKSIFDILHKYSSAGLSKGDNFDLVMASFKCMSVLIRDVKHFTVNTEQLKILILYAEQDLYDNDKQATAFNLLKSILSRKLIVNEIHKVMEKVAALSVTSELDYVRQQSRSVFYSYLMEYPQGKHINTHISFYLSQISYELQPGRLSALEMVYNIITGFPLKILKAHSGVMFLMIGVRLVNDEDPTCRKLVAKCIKDMLQRLSHNEKTKLFEIVLLWFKDEKVSHRRLAAQLCGIFVTVEKEKFESRLKNLLPLVQKQFHANYNDENEPGKFVKIHREEEEENKKSNFERDEPRIKDPERMKDHHLFQVLQLLLKISAHCDAFLKNEKYQEFIRSFAEYSQNLLAHPHLWVRLSSAQLLGFILTTLDIEKVSALLRNSTEEDLTEEIGYIYSNPEETLRSLSLDLIAQLQPDMEFEELGDQVIKNLIFIGRILKTSKEEEIHQHEKSNYLSLLWLLRKLKKAVNIEVTQFPKSTAVRTAVFKWLAGIVATVEMEYLKPILFQMLSPLVREISTTEESNAPLRHLAKDVATMIKKKLGIEEYTQLLNNVQQKLNVRKAERRKTFRQQFITDPELAAKRKIGKQQKKKEARKRKMETMKGKKMYKKRSKREVDLDVSEVI